jgi:sterol 3beta-glucosyltransferase
MHYAIVTYGSRGDVQPYIALSLGLMERGHQVTLLANENFNEMAADYGIEFYPLHGNIQALIETPDVVRIIKSGNTVSFMRRLQKMSHEVQPRVSADLLKGLANSEVIVASPLTLLWIYSVAEKLGKKWAIVQLSVPATPTREFPFAGFSFFNSPRYNIFSHHLVQFVYWSLNKRDVNRFRALLGLPVMERSIIKNIARQRILNLYAFSPYLLSRPKDWDDNVDIIGFLAIPLYKRIALHIESAPLELTEWLQKGEKPFYIGFGSIPIPNPDLLVEMVRELLEKTNCRIIFCQGWSQMPDFPEHERIYSVKSINHAWLFPQCSEALIHGGIGTIAAVLQAGIPPIVGSIFGDQPLWGKLIEQQGLGIHIPFKKITTPRLLEAIAKTRTREMKQKAATLGEQLRKENGAVSAIESLEKYFGHS